jgi:uncharacterized protein YjbI with pentapeptide repeats
MKRVNLFGLVMLLVGMLSLSFNLPKAYAISSDCTARGIGVDLSACDLTGANLSGANLTNAILTSAILNDANFENTNLSGALLNGTTLGRTNFKGANISDVNFYGAIGVIGITSGGILGVPIVLPYQYQLINGYLIGPIANLSHANLKNVNLENVNLEYTDLTGANLTGANLTGVIWNNTTCPDGSNSATNGLSACIALPVVAAPPAPKQCNLSGSHASGCTLIGADLTGKDLNDADFTGIDLHDADLSLGSHRNTNLSNTNLSRANFV